MNRTRTIAARRRRSCGNRCRRSCLRAIAGISARNGSYAHGFGTAITIRMRLFACSQTPIGVWLCAFSRYWARRKSGPASADDRSPLVVRTPSSLRSCNSA